MKNRNRMKIDEVEVGEEYGVKIAFGAVDTTVVADAQDGAS